MKAPFAFFLSFLLLGSCARDTTKRMEPNININSGENKSRYGITLLTPPVVFTNIEAIDGNPGQWPTVLLLSKTGEIYEDENNRETSREESYLEARHATLGLGPTFKFNRVTNDIKEAKTWFDKGSIRISYEGENIKSDHIHGLDEPFTELLRVHYYKDFFDCSLSVAKGLVCRVDCEQPDLISCPKKTAWHDPRDPIIEINSGSYPGIYAITKSGQLIFVMRHFKEMASTRILHSDLKFIPNKNGRYFINASSSAVCMQTDKLDIYCLETSILNNSGSDLGLENRHWPHMEKLLRTDFFAQQIALGAFHYCILSDKGEVWCGGDNRCGQITGRHDGVPEFKEPHKVDFLLGPAKQLIVYPGGTCALLVDGQVQCFGLGASVLRQRLLPKSHYYRSFAWHLGFRPWSICAGGAENGV